MLVDSFSGEKAGAVWTYQVHHVIQSYTSTNTRSCTTRSPHGTVWSRSGVGTGSDVSKISQNPQSGVCASFPWLPASSRAYQPKHKGTAVPQRNWTRIRSVRMDLTSPDILNTSQWFKLGEYRILIRYQESESQICSLSKLWHKCKAERPTR